MRGVAVLGVVLWTGGAAGCGKVVQGEAQDTGASGAGGATEMADATPADDGRGDRIEAGGRGASGGRNSGGRDPGGAGAGGAGGFAGTAFTGGRSPEEPFQECDGIVYEPELVPVDLFVLLDQSVEMGEPVPGDMNSRWTGVVAGIEAFMTGVVGQDVGIGIQYFGLPGDVCSVDAYANPEVPVARVPEVIERIVDSMQGHEPSTDRPLYQPLDGALTYLSHHMAERPTRRGAAVLITGGFATQCQADGTPMGAASLEELEALARQFAEEVPTYVIAVGEGLESFARLAAAGGAGQAFWIDQVPVAEQVSSALQSLIEPPTRCEFLLPVPPPGEVIDPALFNVHIRAPVGDASEVVYYVGSEGACIDGEGWYYDDSSNPSRLHLCPATCMAASGARLELSLDCPRRYPPPP